MFEQLVSETAARFNLSTASVTALTRGILSLMTEDRTDGAEGFARLFHRAGHGAVITSWFDRKEGKPLLPTQLDSALGPGVLDKLAASSGLKRAAAGSAAAFMVPRLIGLLTPNGSLPSTSALRSHAWSPVNRSEVTAGEHRVEPGGERPAGVGWLHWAAIAAALLTLGAFLWLLRTPAGTIDPQLRLTNRDGKITCSGVVRDEATRRTIVTALGKTFGEGDISGDLRVDPDVRDAGWLPRIDGLVASLKHPGVNLSASGDTVEIGGWLTAADRKSLADSLHSTFGAAATLEMIGDPAEEAARVANDKAQ